MDPNEIPNADDVQVVNGVLVFAPPSQTINKEAVEGALEVAQQAISDAQSIINRNQPIVDNCQAILAKLPV